MHISIEDKKFNRITYTDTLANWKPVSRAKSPKSSIYLFIVSLVELIHQFSLFLFSEVNHYYRLVWLGDTLKENIVYQMIKWIFSLPT